MSKFPHQYPPAQPQPQSAGCNWCGNKKAFTLVEILVAAALLAIISGSFYYIFKNSLAFEKNAERKLKAAFLLRSKMEELRAISFNDLALQNGQTFGGGRGKIKAVPANPDLIEILVEYKWDPDKNPIQLCSLRSK